MSEIKDFQQSLLTRMLQHERRRRELAEEALAAERSAYENLRDLVDHVSDWLGQTGAVPDESQSEPEALSDDWPDMAVALGLHSDADADTMLARARALQQTEDLYTRLRAALAEKGSQIPLPPEEAQEATSDSEGWYALPPRSDRPSTLGARELVLVRDSAGRITGPVEARLVKWRSGEVRFWREA